MVEVFDADDCEGMEANNVKVPRPLTDSPEGIPHEAKVALERAGQMLGQCVGEGNLVQARGQGSTLKVDALISQLKY
jgi:hypothetical protein